MPWLNLLMVGVKFELPNIAELNLPLLVFFRGRTLGLIAIDSMIPIGRSQREFIIGDRPVKQQ